MKHFRFTALLLFSVILFSCKNTPTQEEVIAYNDKISTEHGKIFEKHDQLLKSYDDFRQTEKMDKAYADAKKQVEESIAKVKKLGALGGDSTYKLAAIKAFESYLSSINNEHKRFIEIYKLPEDKFDSALSKEQEKIMETINTSLNSANQELAKVQQDLAKKYKFELVPDKK